MSDTYPYNDDFLVTPEDQEQAKREYPAIAFAFIFPELVALAIETDSVAQKAKKEVWRRGFLSVLMVVCSLLVASVSPLYSEFHPWSQVVAITAAIIGIIGGILAFLNRQTSWLEHRLVTESLRQFHFRLIVQLSPEILRAVESGDLKEFEDKRQLALATFKQDYVKRKSGSLRAIIDDPEPPAGGEIETFPEASIFESENGKSLLDAYRQFRILRQRQFADHKLTKKGTFFSKFPRDQADRLSLIGILLVAFLFVVHIGSALFVTLSQEALDRWFQYGAIWIALIALALRAVEEGLKPRAEIERYRHYQAATRRILEEFDKGDIKGKLQAVRNLERVAYDELAIFLRSHEDSGFVM